MIVTSRAVWASWRSPGGRGGRPHADPAAGIRVAGSGRGDRAGAGSAERVAVRGEEASGGGDCRGPQPRRPVGDRRRRGTRAAAADDLVPTPSADWSEVHSFPIDRYTERPLVMEGGRAVAPDEPGTGVVLDLERLRAACA